MAYHQCTWPAFYVKIYFMCWAYFLKTTYHWCQPEKFSKNLATNMAAQAVVFQDCQASGVNLKRNLIQTSLGRRQRGFYVLFCVFNVPWLRHWQFHYQPPFPPQPATFLGDCKLVTLRVCGKKVLDSSVPMYREWPLYSLQVLYVSFIDWCCLILMSSIHSYTESSSLKSLTHISGLHRGLGQKFIHTPAPPPRSVFRPT